MSTLTYGPGEIFGYLGPNGAGKSTTIRMLLDHIRPTRGTGTVFGLDIRRDSVEIRRNIGYLPGEFALYDHMTGRAMLQYFANLRGGVDWQYVDDLTTAWTWTSTADTHSYLAGTSKRSDCFRR